MLNQLVLLFSMRPSIEACHDHNLILAINRELSFNAMFCCLYILFLLGLICNFVIRHKERKWYNIVVVFAFTMRNNYDYTKQALHGSLVPAKYKWRDMISY
jgi:hypothetical protein